MNWSTQRRLTGLNNCGLNLLAFWRWLELFLAILTNEKLSVASVWVCEEYWIYSCVGYLTNYSPPSLAYPFKLTGKVMNHRVNRKSHGSQSLQNTSLTNTCANVSSSDISKGNISKQFI